MRFLILLGFAVLAAMMVYAIANRGERPSQIAEAFFAAAARGDGAGAHALAARPWRERSDNARLLGEVRDLGLTGAATSDWAVRRMTEDDATLEGQVTTARGTETAVRLRFEKEDGDWRILAIEPIGLPATASAAAMD